MSLKEDIAALRIEFTQSESPSINRVLDALEEAQRVIEFYSEYRNGWGYLDAADALRTKAAAWLEKYGGKKKT